MAPPIYFFAGKSHADLVDDKGQLRRETLASVGLDGVLADVATVDQASVFDQASAGPGGSSGVFLVALAGGEPAKRVGYFPDFQTWRPALAKGLWIGVDREQPPTPADLQRRRVLLGYSWKLPAGEAHVPILRSSAGNGSLPEKWGYDEAGQFCASVREEYQDLWEESELVWDVVFARRPGLSIDRPQGLDLCLKILGLNYRYGRDEQNLLGWVDSSNWQDILSLAVDLPSVLAYQRQIVGAEGEADQKKTCPQQGSSSVSPGVPASAPSTDPAEARSG